MSVSLIHSPVSTLRVWQQRQRERRWLLELDSHILQDMGISASDAWQEARKPFWKA